MFDATNLPVYRKDSIHVGRFLERLGADLDLRVIAGFQGQGRPVYSADINRPGLALSGYLDYFASDRIQILGNTEIHYMERLRHSELQWRLARMLSFEVPAFILSRDLRPAPIFLDMCNRRGLPVLQSSKSTDEVISRVILFLADEFSPSTEVHATAVEVFGVGILISGMPGVGKSETALELVERGHRLVADDMVTLRRKRDDTIHAESPPVIEHHMEIRGVGFIDIQSMFGVGCVRNTERVGLIIELEEWRQEAGYDRTGLKDEFVNLLDVRLPYLLVPVRPGRNIAVIIEVAALNHRLKEMGIHTAQRLNERILGIMHANK